MNGITASTALWYASRATGVVALLLLTAGMLLGLLVNRQGRLPGLPRFGVAGLHRNLSLLAVTFVAVHVITALADPLVTIGLAAVVIPFVSPYEPFWLGLGAVSLDMTIALIATSLLRARLGRRVWRAIHWAAYVSWPVPFAHGIGSSSDMRSGGLLWLAIGCALVLAAALTWRVATAAAPPRRAQRAGRILAAAQGCDAARQGAAFPPGSPGGLDGAGNRQASNGHFSQGPTDGELDSRRAGASLAVAHSRQT